MRSSADNFTDYELGEVVKYTHSLGKKLYVTVNTMPRHGEYPALREYLGVLGDIKPDALIIADLGVLSEVKRIIPGMPVHISTQASIISPEAALAYAALGASRLVLARELSIGEIREIRDALPRDVEIEAFVHGSMCVSYSGRCMLSNHLAGRDANRGECTQPCRWNYVLYEEKRPGQAIPIEENELGTFIMSSKDMCMLGYVPELIKAGISSFKIEGRVKSAYYTAVVTNAYRMAIDAYFADPAGYKPDPALFDELDSVSHREYSTGFYFDDPMKNAQLCRTPGYIRDKAFYATALEMPSSGIPYGLEEENRDGRLYFFVQRNKVNKDGTAEIISPGKVGREFCIRELYDENGVRVDSTPHPAMKYYARVPFEVKPGDIMRAGDEG
jgi:putative protease